MSLWECHRPSLPVSYVSYLNHTPQCKVSKHFFEIEMLMSILHKKFNISIFTKRYWIHRISQKWLEKKNCRKNYKNHLRSINYELCTGVARCFPNILDVMVNLSSDKIGRPSLWSKFLSSVAYIRCQQCIFQPHVNLICTCTLDLKLKCLI
jgi:hypothetical protein